MNNAPFLYSESESPAMPSSPAEPAVTLLNGHEAGRLYGLGGNVLTFLRHRGKLAPAVHEHGRKPLYRREDLIRCAAEIENGTIVLTGSALQWYEATSEKPAEQAAPVPQAEPVDFEAVELDETAEIAAALRPLADLASMTGADMKPASFPLVMHRGLPVLTMNDAREARLALSKLREARS